METFKELLIVMIACIGANNFILKNFVGYDSLTKEAKSAKNPLWVAILLTVTLLIAATIVNALEIALIPAVPALRTLIYVAVIMIAAYVVSLVADRIAALKGNVTFTSILLNSAVLGTLLLLNVNGYTWAQSYFAVLGTGIGYYLVSLIMNGIVDRISMKYIPQSFRGYPIYLAAFSIVAMAIYAL